MAEFTVGAFELGPEIEIDFADFISIVMGLSIKSAADWGEDRIELGLSGDLMMRIFWTEAGLRVNLLSTTNRDEVPPLILNFMADGRRPNIATLERRLHGLRQLHAIIFALQEGRQDGLAKLLQSETDLDIEGTLLSAKERLHVESIGPGSWIVVLAAKLRSSYKAVLSFVSVVYPTGRDALLRRLEAETKLKELNVEREQVELAARKTDVVLSLAERMPDPKIKQKLYDRVERELSAFLDAPVGTPQVTGVAAKMLGTGGDISEGKH